MGILNQCRLHECSGPSHKPTFAIRKKKVSKRGNDFPVRERSKVLTLRVYCQRQQLQTIGEEEYRENTVNKESH